MHWKLRSFRWWMLRLGILGQDAHISKNISEEPASTTLILSTMKMELAGPLRNVDTYSINLYQTTRRRSPRDRFSILYFNAQNDLLDLVHSAPALYSGGPEFSSQSEVFCDLPQSLQGRCRICHTNSGVQHKEANTVGSDIISMIKWHLLQSSQLFICLLI
jgi:hypothetical protein